MQDFPLQIIYKVKAGKKFHESNLSSNKAVQINNATSNPSTSLSRTLFKKKKSMKTHQMSRIIQPSQIN